LPSQWALQYFDPSAGTQLQAGFAHFFGFAMMHLPWSIRSCLALMDLTDSMSGFDVAENEIAAFRRRKGGVPSVTSHLTFHLPIVRAGLLPWLPEGIPDD
jgi:hypothetical protein